MRMFKRILVALLALAVMAVIIVFMLENRQPVALNFMGWAAPEIAVAVPVLLALLLGLAIGPVFAWIITLRRKPRRAV
ncbi:lipopolysaccharide assembly protein LapA domain-containing protein [Pseudomonas sp. JDS28PS106]|uniref:lipopolysaccharide assembly protein LapA domain-containing protein n=1 Tax=Pseudomonas sp. JDS28PS106 TaxID=2497235 RepID=UPI002FD1C671